MKLNINGLILIDSKREASVSVECSNIEEYKRALELFSDKGSINPAPTPFNSQVHNYSAARQSQANANQFTHAPATHATPNVANQHESIDNHHHASQQNSNSPDSQSNNLAPAQLWGSGHQIGAGAINNSHNSQPQWAIKTINSAWLKVAGGYPQSEDLGAFGEILLTLLEQPDTLEHSELYHMRAAAISSAALGAVHEDDVVHADYRTPALMDTMKLYNSYARISAKAQELGKELDRIQKLWETSVEKHQDAEYWRNRAGVAEAAYKEIVALTQRHGYQGSGGEDNGVLNQLSQWLDTFSKSGDTMLELTSSLNQARQAASNLTKELYAVKDDNNRLTRSLDKLDKKHQKLVVEHKELKERVAGWSV